MRDCVWPQGHSPGLCRGGKRRSGAAEIRPRRTSAVAMTAVMTLRATVVRLGEYRRPPNDHVPILPRLLDGALEMPFAAGHLHGWEKLPVGQIRDVLRRAADAHE